MYDGDRGKTASKMSPRFEACSMAASQSRYRSRTMHGLIVIDVGVVLQRAGVVRTISMA
jgi:hypothetical protein